MRGGWGVHAGRTSRPKWFLLLIPCLAICGKAYWQGTWGVDYLLAPWAFGIGFQYAPDPEAGNARSRAAKQDSRAAKADILSLKRIGPGRLVRLDGRGDLRDQRRVRQCPAPTFVFCSRWQASPCFGHAGIPRGVPVNISPDPGAGYKQKRNVARTASPAARRP